MRSARRSGNLHRGVSQMSHHNNPVAIPAIQGTSAAEPHRIEGANPIRISAYSGLVGGRPEFEVTGLSTQRNDAACRRTQSTRQLAT